MSRRTPIEHSLIGLIVLLLLAPVPALAQPVTPATSEGMATPAAEFPTEGTEILWDTWGVPHITAPDEPSLFYAFGWAQMRNHASNVLGGVAVSRGRAAEYFGQELVASDRVIRTMRLAEHGAAWYATQLPDFQANLDAFAAGINSYAAANPSAIAPWFAAVLPVTGVDVITSFAYGAYIASGSASGCIDMGTGEPIIDRTAPGTTNGSNGWSVGPSRTASGNTLLLANPHWSWSPNAAFFEAQLTIPGQLNVYGAASPGQPVLMFAFNDNLGWTLTFNLVDSCDLYELTLVDGGYLFDGEVRPFTSRMETINVLNLDGTVGEVELEVRESVHGPVFGGNGRAIAVRLAPFTRAATAAGGLQQFWDMGRAENLAEFEAAVSRLQQPMYTIIYADRDGHILSLFNGQVPIRPKGAWDWAGILPGDTTANLWHEIHPYADLPRVVDPPGGWVQNSNSAPWYTAYPLQLDPADFPDYMAPEILGWREIRGIRMLEENSAMTLDQLVALKHSTRFELADRILDDLVAAARAADDETARRAADVLAAWDREANPESTGALLFAMWVMALESEDGRMLSDLFAIPLDPATPLSTPAGLADPDAAVAALVVAAERTEAAYGRLDVPWGEVARIQRGTVDEPANGFAGDPYGVFRVLSIDASQIDAGAPLPVVFGDSFIAAVEFSDPVRAYVLTSYGNATESGSPHLDDQLALAAEAELRPAWLTREDVEANLADREVLPPAPSS